MNELLEAAQAWREIGYAVIAVNGEKRPYRDGWNRYFTEEQTENELRGEFANGAIGLAGVLYPASPYVHLDFDGPHAREAWKQTAIELPETARNITRSGGEHLVFRASALLRSRELKRKVRIVSIQCDCAKQCGVDLLINGYAVLPPTPGYREDADAPIERAVELPDAIVEFALANEKQEKKSGRVTGDENGRIKDGGRNDTLFSLAGSMRRRGMTYESILAALLEENRRRCDPPLDDDEVERIARSGASYEPAGVFENLTDMGNAARFARMHSDNAKHSPRLGWMLWDGKRYRRDDTQEVERLARQTVRAILGEAERETDKDRSRELAEWALKSQSEAKLNPMIRLAESEPDIAVKPEIFDRDPFVFNVDNGTLDLRTAKLRPHSRSDLITKVSTVPYDPEATCPLWLQFLDQIFKGDEGLIRYVQKVCGYCLTGDTREQEFYVFYGLGANGKSTLVNILMQVLGEYSAKTRAETFLVKRNSDGSAANSDVARLAGARLVAATESEAGQRMAESLVKAMTGGDGITARFLYKESFEYQPQFKLILSTNHRPVIKGTDNAIWRRLKPIPFAVTIPKEAQDKDLPDKLEAELPGILRWCVEGCLLWQREGLAAPAAVLAAFKAYREDMDVLGEFLAACCELEPEATITKKELYAAYCAWCEDQKMSDRERLSQKAFKRVLVERGVEDGRNKKERLWRGIGLKKDDLDEAA